MAKNDIGVEKNGIIWNAEVAGNDGEFRKVLGDRQGRKFFFEGACGLRRKMGHYGPGNL